MSEDEVVTRTTESATGYRVELVEPKPPDYAAIIEGRCPTCGTPLERRERDGWCTACGVGWAYRTTGRNVAELSLTIEPRTVELSTSLERASSPRFRSSNPRIVVTRPVPDGV